MGLRGKYNNEEELYMVRLAVDNTQEYFQDLFDQLIENGYMAKNAMEMLNKKAINEREILRVKNRVEVLKIVPIRYLDLPKDKKLASKYLEELGYNTLKFPWAIDVCCYTWGGKRECGEVLIGSERTDKKWVNKRVNGKRVASDEAVDYHSKVDYLARKGRKHAI